VLLIACNFMFIFNWVKYTLSPEADGFDVNTETYTDMFDVGCVDPKASFVWLWRVCGGTGTRFSTVPHSSHLLVSLLSDGPIVRQHVLLVGGGWPSRVLEDLPVRDATTPKARLFAFCALRVACLLPHVMAATVVAMDSRVHGARFLLSGRMLQVSWHQQEHECAVDHLGACSA